MAVRFDVDGVIPLSIVKLGRGTTHKWNKIANNPSADTQYEFDNGYVYRTDGEKRVSYVQADLKYDPWYRNAYQQRIAGKDCRLDTDCGGHLIGAVFGGPGEALNLVPMDRTLNGGGGQWGVMERVWKGYLDQGQSVKVDIKPIYTGGSRRPDRFEVTFRVDGGPPEREIIHNTATGQ